MSDITIHFAGPGDGEALAAMIDAQDRYRGDPERSVGETRVALDGWWRAGTSDSRFVLVFAGDEPVGFASVAVLHPGNALSGLLFLKDLFITTDWRGRGIGEQVMKFLADFCLQHGLGRIDWVVEDARSQHFYERFGATAQPQKRFMRLDGQALADLAER
jgi:GNAT superfamily N-acetyltransferase